jgi:hypothetical protein
MIYLKSKPSPVVEKPTWNQSKTIQKPKINLKIQILTKMHALIHTFFVIYYSGTSQVYFVNNFEDSHSQNITKTFKNIHKHSRSFIIIHNNS